MRLLLKKKKIRVILMKMNQIMIFLKNLQKKKRFMFLQKKHIMEQMTVFQNQLNMNMILKGERLRKQI